MNMKHSSTTLKSAVEAAIQHHEQQHPLLTREEIKALLQEAENKKSLSSPLHNRSYNLPVRISRTLKILSAATLSAAAVTLLFLWKSNDKITPDKHSEPIAQTIENKQEYKRQNSALQKQNTITFQEKNALVSTESQKKAQNKKTDADNENSVNNQKATASATYNGGGMAAPAIVFNSNENSEEGSDYSFRNTPVITLPNKIDPVMAKHINEPETVLGITFAENTEHPRQDYESSQTKALRPPVYSMNRSLMSESNSLDPNNKSLLSEKQLGEIQQSSSNRAVQDRTYSHQSLMHLLINAAANPRMVTLVRKKSIIVNEWSGEPVENINQLSPVYVPLQNNESAANIADYALLWLPASSHTAPASQNFAMNIKQSTRANSEILLRIQSDNLISVGIAVYDVLGNKIRDLLPSESFSKGIFQKEFTFDAPDGIYTAVAINSSGTQISQCQFAIARNRK